MDFFIIDNVLGTWDKRYCSRERQTRAIEITHQHFVIDRHIRSHIPIIQQHVFYDRTRALDHKSNVMDTRRSWLKETCHFTGLILILNVRSSRHTSYDFTCLAFTSVKLITLPFNFIIYLLFVGCIHSLFWRCMHCWDSYHCVHNSQSFVYFFFFFRNFLQRVGFIAYANLILTDRLWRHSMMTLWRLGRSSD